MPISDIITASATVFYIIFTSWLLYEQRRERKKPFIQQITKHIIYPIIRELKHQKTLFEKGEFFWLHDDDSYNRRKLVPTRDEIKRIYNDLPKELQNIATDIEKYDRALDKQKTFLDNITTKNNSLPDLKNEIYRKIEEYESETKAKHVDRRKIYKNDNSLKFILECIINNTQELPSGNGNTYHYFWNQYGNELIIKFRESEEYKFIKAEIEKGYNNLFDLSNSILKDLEDILAKYKDKYGVPYKEPGNWKHQA